MNKEDLTAEGKKWNIKDITDEEYESVKKWGLQTALTKIRNARGNVAQSMKGVQEIWKGIFLGSRDNPSKKPIADSRGQRLSLFRDIEGEKSFDELTRWGSLPEEIAPGDDLEIEVRIKPPTVTEEGRQYENKTAKVLKVQTDGKDVLSKLSIDKLIEMFHPQTNDTINEEHADRVIAFRGEIKRIERVPIWEDGAIVDEQNLYYNEQPCLRIGFDIGGSGNAVRANLNATKLSKPIITFPDLREICEENDEDDCINSFVTRHAMVIGMVTRYDVGEPNNIDIAVTAIFALEGASDEVIGKAPEETRPKEQSLETFDKKEAPAKPKTGNDEKLNKLLEKVEKVMSDTGLTELLPDDIYKLGVFTPEEVNEKLLTAIITKVAKKLNPE